MNYLAIDASNENLTVIACKNDKIYTYYDPVCGVRHSTELLVKTETLLNDADLKLSDVDFIAAVVGAGSFTGIRIGVSTAQALCFAVGKPCLAITSFDTLAYNVKGKVAAVIDAGHNGVYAAGYDDGKIVISPGYFSIEEFSEAFNGYRAVAKNPINGLDVQTVSVESGLVAAIEAKKEYVTDDLNALEPLYVRKSQAEEGRP